MQPQSHSHYFLMSCSSRLVGAACRLCSPLSSRCFVSTSSFCRRSPPSTLLQLITGLHCWLFSSLRLLLENFPRALKNEPKKLSLASARLNGSTPSYATRLGVPVTLKLCGR